MLFWTMQSVKGRQLQLLGEQFGTWLRKKYGSLDRALRAWDGDAMPEDDFSLGIVGIHIVWEWTQEREGGRKRRLDDQLQFFAATMYRFNQEIGHSSLLYGLGKYGCMVPVRRLVSRFHQAEERQSLTPVDGQFFKSDAIPSV